MRKPWLIKSVFAAAIICTCLGVVAVFAEFAVYSISKMQDVSAPSLIPAIIIAAVCSFLLWEFHYSLTHDSLGRKVEPSAEPIYKKNVKLPTFPYDPPPIGRFDFDEDFFFEKMITIAKRFGLKLSYTTSYSWDNNEVLWHEAVLNGKYNFTLSFRDDIISITPIDLNIHNYYTFRYSFELIDENLRDDNEAYKHVGLDRGFEYTAFTSDIMFDDLSDDKIFDIVEKIIEVFYGANSMDYEIITADDGKQSFIFYLDAPDYYGYTETTEIGNFKFILNKENGGN